VQTTTALRNHRRLYVVEARSTDKNSRALKMQEIKMRDINMKDKVQTARSENAGHARYIKAEEDPHPA